ncbi:hypothetical protein [Streptomyces sp. Tue6028]|uniref:hypothetical protein n=1 Tax=Streptomyces sp. Tue6028 TaxID=2036037 RepID=UPI003D7056EE
MHPAAPEQAPPSRAERSARSGQGGGRGQRRAPSGLFESAQLALPPGRGRRTDLDSNPTKLIEIVEIGKQLLITRGALTTAGFRLVREYVHYAAGSPVSDGRLSA